MRTLSAPVLAALADGKAALVQLVHINFPSGVIAINSSNWDLVWDAVTYRGAYGLGTVSAISDTAGGAVQGITLEMAATDSAMVALALDDANEVQDSPVVIRTAILDTATYEILDAPIDFTGRCDVMSISGRDGSEVIRVSVESSAVDILRGNVSTYSDADQQAAYAGDRAFEYVVDQADKPIVWPSREFFFQ
jgi:hypothetical protein